MKLKINELMAQTGATLEQVALVMWPDATPHTRYVLMKRWEKSGYSQAGLEKLKALAEFFNVKEIDQLITTESDGN